MNLFGELLVQCFYVTGEVRFSTKLWPNDTEAPTDMTQLFCICHQNFYPTNWKWLSFVIEFIKIDLVLMNMCGLLCLHSFGGNRTGWVLPFSLFYSDFIRSLQKVLNPFQINGFFLTNEQYLQGMKHDDWRKRKKDLQLYRMRMLFFFIGTLLVLILTFLRQFFSFISFIMM